MIYYYRYLRFFEDGSVVYRVWNRKIPIGEIVEQLSVKKLEDNSNDNLIGEYMQYKEKVYVKAAKNN